VKKSAEFVSRDFAVAVGVRGYENFLNESAEQGLSKTIAKKDEWQKRAG
jgi:hypothetical protein